MPKTSRHDLDTCDDDIAHEYLRSAARSLNQIKAAIEANAMAKVEHLSHRLAGTSAFLELTVFANLLRDMELAATAGRSEKALRLLRPLQKEFDQIHRHAAPRFLKATTRSKTPHLRATGKPIKLLIVDDHASMLAGLKRLIALHPEFSVCGEAATAAQAMAVVSTCHPDIVLLDISLGGDDGIQLIQGLRQGRRPPQILVLSVHTEPAYAERAFRAGAQGYLMKQLAAKQLINAITRLLAGKRYLSPA